MKLKTSCMMFAILVMMALLNQCVSAQQMDANLTILAGRSICDAFYSSNSPVTIHFEGNNNRTYVVYLNTETRKGKITYFDHSSLTWTEPVVFADIPYGYNPPSMEIDDLGYIHIFYGGHARIIYYIKSSNPEDITSWGEVKQITIGTSVYPLVLSSGNIVLFSKWYDKECVIKSIDSGENWGSNSPYYNNSKSWFIMDGGSVGSSCEEAFYCTGIMKGAKVNQTDRIHIGFFSFRGCSRKNVYYCFSDDEGVTWYNASKGYSDTLIEVTEADKYYMVFESETFNYSNYQVDNVKCKHFNNVPYLSFSYGGATNGSVKFAKWNGNSWSIHTVATGYAKNGRFWSDLDTVSSSVHYIYTSGAPLICDIKEYKTTDGGENWILSKNITTDGTVDDFYKNPFVIRGEYSDKLKIIYLKGCRLYWYDFETNASKFITLSDPITQVDVYIDGEFVDFTNSTFVVSYGNHTIFVGDYWEHNFTSGISTGYRYGFEHWNDTAINPIEVTISGNTTLIAYFIRAYCPGDVDGNYEVKLQDLDMLELSYGSKVGDLDWNPCCDVVYDHKITWYDLAWVGINYGNTY